MSTVVNLNTNTFNIKWLNHSCGMLIGNKIGPYINVFLPIQSITEEDFSSKERVDFSDLLDSIKGHAEQLLRMLPGSIAILGCYAVSDEISFPENSSNFQATLKDIFSKEQQFKYNLLSDFDSEKIFLLVNPQNRRFKCKKIELTDENGSFEEISTLSHLNVFEGFRCFQSSIYLRIDIFVPSQINKERHLWELLKMSVQPYVTNFISQSVMLVNGQQLSANTNMSITRDTLGRDMIRFTNGAASHQMNLTFIGMNLMNPEEDLEMNNRMRIVGWIPCVAFLPTRTTVGDIETALKKDLTLSLYSRIELLTEWSDYACVLEEVYHPVVGRRAKITLPSCPTLPLMDYKFLSETAEDVLGRIRHFCKPAGLVETDIGIECIDMNFE